MKKRSLAEDATLLLSLAASDTNPRPITCGPWDAGPMLRIPIWNIRDSSYMMD